VNCKKYKVPLKNKTSNKKQQKGKLTSDKVLLSAENYQPNINAVEQATLMAQQVQLQSSDFLPEASAREMMKNTYDLQRETLSDSNAKLVGIIQIQIQTHTFIHLNSYIWVYIIHFQFSISEFL
jgi:hypothetical protein